MKAFVWNTVPDFAHPEEMEKILKYLNEHGKLQVTETMVESMYYDFCFMRDDGPEYDDGWLPVTDSRLEAFAYQLSTRDV